MTYPLTLKHNRFRAHILTHVRSISCPQNNEASRASLSITLIASMSITPEPQHGSNILPLGLSTEAIIEATCLGVKNCPRYLLLIFHCIYTCPRISSFVLLI